MSDDLVQALRDSKGWPTLGHAAADCIREQRDLLDECKKAFSFIAQPGCDCDECNRAREMLAKLRGRENADE